MCTLECARCEATFTVSEELCGECDEVLDEVWAERLGANLVAAGLASAFGGLAMYVHELEGQNENLRTVLREIARQDGVGVSVTRVKDDFTDSLVFCIPAAEAK